LDGKYPYKYGEEITSTYIYDPKGKLISLTDYSNKRNFYHNIQGQTIKIEVFSNPFFGEKEKKVSEQIFHYDSQGLPLKVVETNLESGKVITYTFEFK
jgi:hypothetical protein